MAGRVLDVVLALIGAAVGGAIGYAVFRWMYSQGFYAVILPGAFLGLGAGLLSRERSSLRGAVLGLAGFLLGSYADWELYPFKADDSFGYFLSHIHRIEPVQLLMIALGGFFAYWWGREAIPGIMNRWKAVRSSSASEP
jgi:hypothetical protein